MKIQGVYTAIVTPFANGVVDYGALNALVDAQIEAGVAGLIPVGTTGESPTLEHKEHIDVIEAVCNRVANRVQVIAGTGSNSTSEAIELTQAAKAVGAHATLQVTPYYNRPTQEGIYRHICEVSAQGELPVVLYNIPGRTGASMEIHTIKRMVNDAHIIAIKEAAGSVERVAQIHQEMPSLAVLSGDDGLTLPMMSVGAVGVISVASHIAPKSMIQMVNFALQNDYESARKIHFKLLDLFKNLFIEPNPVPVKYALSVMNRMSDDVRLPLCGMSAENQQIVRDTLARISDMA